MVACSNGKCSTIEKRAKHINLTKTMIITTYLPSLSWPNAGHPPHSIHPLLLLFTFFNTKSKITPVPTVILWRHYLLMVG